MTRRRLQFDEARCTADAAGPGSPALESDPRPRRAAVVALLEPVDVWSADLTIVGEGWSRADVSEGHHAATEFHRDWWAARDVPVLCEGTRERLVRFG